MKDMLESGHKIAPGKRAPTVMTTSTENLVAVEVMIEKTKVAHTLDQLLDIGAKDILVLPLLNTRTSD